MKIPMIPYDKVNHFIYGILAATAFVVVAAAFRQPTFLVHAAIVGSILAGVLKEVLDWLGNKTTNEAEAPQHDVSFADALATGLGCIPVVVIILATTLA